MYTYIWIYIYICVCTYTYILLLIKIVTGCIWLLCERQDAFCCCEESYVDAERKTLCQDWDRQESLFMLNLCDSFFNQEKKMWNLKTRKSAPKTKSFRFPFQFWNIFSLCMSRDACILNNAIHWANNANNATHWS